MRKQKGFTLVELVVVVMILGILAAVAAPKLLGTSGAATDNSLRQTLAVVRDAIERYAAENGGTLPAEGTTGAAGATAFKDDLTQYLRGAFPTSPLSGGNSDVTVVSDDEDISADAEPTTSWKYSSATGQFIANSPENSHVNPSMSYDKF